jgi:outer membrane protein assembly factor BamD
MKTLQRFLALTFLVSLLLAGCASKDKDKIPPDQPVNVLYNKAADALDKGDYKVASDDFEEVERQHPYSQWATRAQLMSAYALYRHQDYDSAVEALDQFDELHPGNANIDYALYLKALCYYEQITDVSRDQEMTKNALDALDALIQRFPNSRYTQDAILKRDLTTDHLAGKQMDIGRYYLHRHQVQAAINRFDIVVKDYQTTTHVPEALERLVECYMTLGLKGQATRIAAVLGYNYPGSKWYADAYRLLDDRQRTDLINNRSLTDRTVESLFKPD